MNIFSKELLLGDVTSLETYNVKLIQGFSNISDLGNTKKINSSFASKTNGSRLYVFKGNIYLCTSSQLTQVTNSGGVTDFSGTDISSTAKTIFIENGALKVASKSSSNITITQLGTDTTWKMIAEYSTGAKGFVINSDGLYYLENTTLTKISDITNWDKITYGSGCGFGIADGKLYRIYSTEISQVGAETDWSDITGWYASGSYTYYGYGIKGGKLYYLSDTVTQIGSSTTWTGVSGFSSSTMGNGYKSNALGINAGKLYRLVDGSATRIGSLSTWQGCSGHLNNTSGEGPSTTCGLAYTDSALYKIYADGSSTKLMDGEFVYCGGELSNSNINCAIAIRKV